MATSRTPRPLRFFVTGALLMGPVACGDTPIEDMPTHNEAPPPNVEPEQPVEEPAPEVVEQTVEEEQAPPEVDPSSLAGINETLGEINSNAVPPHLRPPSPLRGPTMNPQGRDELPRED